jgi:hypothetical protein
MSAAHLLGIGAERRLHGERRVTGPYGVVLVGNRGAKERHNAVAQHLVHGAFVAVHCVHHGVQGGIQKLLGGFGVEVADERQRVFEIRKQHRDVLTLAFQSGAGRADLLRKGYGGIRQGRPLLPSVQRALPSRDTRRGKRGCGPSRGESRPQVGRRLRSR